MIKCEVYYSMMRIMVKKMLQFHHFTYNIALSALLSVRILIFLFKYTVRLKIFFTKREK